MRGTRYDQFCDLWGIKNTSKFSKAVNAEDCSSQGGLFYYTITIQTLTDYTRKSKNI